MSKFPRLNLRNISKPVVQKPPLAGVPKPPHRTAFRYIIMIAFVILGSAFILLFIPSSSIRHMRRLNCKFGTDGYVCDGERYGDIILKSSESCMNEMYDINGVPFNVAKRGTIFRVPSSERIIIKDAYPHCKLDMFHDSVENRNEYEFVWVTTSDHTEFTVYNGADVLMERVAAEFIPSVRQGKWIAYTYKGTDVNGNGNTPIYTFLNT